MVLFLVGASSCWSKGRSKQVGMGGGNKWVCLLLLLCSSRVLMWL